MDDGRKLLNLEDNEYTDETRVVVALEKKHTDEIVLTYYIQKTRKNLFLYSFDDEGNVMKEKKDPFGITVTEVYHSNKMMNEKYLLNLQDLKKIKKLLKDSYIRSQED